MKKYGPLEFLSKAQEDSALSAQVLEAVERGGLVTAEAVMQIAEKAGFSFSREEFEAAVTRSMEE